jgi:hypothetical protein
VNVLLRVDLDVVDQAQLVDVDRDLGVVDGPQGGDDLAFEQSDFDGLEVGRGVGGDAVGVTGVGGGGGIRC